MWTSTPRGSLPANVVFPLPKATSDSVRTISKKQLGGSWYLERFFPGGRLDEAAVRRAAGSTELGKAGKVYRDGRLWLDW